MIVNLAKIYTMVGLFDNAFILYRILLKNPSTFSVKLLQIDPVWKPLLNRQEIKTLIQKYDQLKIIRNRQA